MKKCKINNSGFTLIEILVSATIIGLLSTIGLTSFQAITRSGRDALRKSDLEAIRSALEIYKSEYNTYPDASGCAADLPAAYISPYPADPKSADFNYCYKKVDSLHYNLCAHLENGTSSDLGAECGGNSSNNCTGSCNYKVTNP